jgi:hypothetical protein
MPNVTLSTAAKEAIRNWVARVDSYANPIPWLSWGSVNRGKEYHEGWGIAVCEKTDKLKPAIKIIDGIEMVVSDHSLNKHGVSGLMIDFANGRFTFNGKEGV